ncbi:MAG: Na+/H+ antiporter subunit E [Candidatus Omnitrophota bacterium]
MTAKIVLFMLWLFVWLFLSWPPDTSQIVTGILVSLFVTLMTGDLFTRRARVSRGAGRYLWFLYYVAVFLTECVKANIDVAWRVIHPDVPIRPGTLRVKLDLKSDTGITFLANSLTLTPGTTSVDIDRSGGILYIHCISIKESADGSYAKMAVVKKFEDILRRIFE